jgi:hypothetical protein
MSRALECRVDTAWQCQEKNRRIVWVCHSLGGIVVKAVGVPRLDVSLQARLTRAEHKALVLAKLKARYNSLLESTDLVVFLGTPHKGSRHAKLGSMVLSILNKVLYKAPAELPGNLTPNHENLMNLNDDVSEILSDIRIVSYFEVMPMPKMKTCVSSTSRSTVSACPLISDRLSRENRQCLVSREKRHSQSMPITGGCASARMQMIRYTNPSIVR